MKQFDWNSAQNIKIPDIQKKTQNQNEKSNESLLSDSIYSINQENEVRAKNILNSNPFANYDKNVNYYQEYWKMYLHNEVLIAQMKHQVIELKSIKENVIEQERICEEQEQQIRENDQKRTKKNRRMATEIQKHFLCPYEQCQKPYGSEVSLNLHIKLKHGGGNKTEREKLAKSIIQAEQFGFEKPQTQINFPPGYLEKYKNSEIDLISNKKEQEQFSSN